MRNTYFLLILVSLVVSLWFFMEPIARAEQYEYQAKGKRDPFVALVGINRVASSNLGDIVSPDALKLEGIAFDGPAKKSAILNGEIVREKDVYGQLEIVKIAQAAVIVKISGKEYTMTIPEEGVKSEK